MSTLSLRERLTMAYAVARFGAPGCRRIRLLWVILTTRARYPA